MPTFTTTVRDLSHKGLGVIDHPDGRTFFVRGTWPGDEGEFEVHEGAQKYDEARLLRLLMPSPGRVEIACKHRGIEMGKCGGCPWMMADYSSQLEQKVKRLQHALQKRRIRIDEDVFKPILSSPQVFNYRNRVQLKTDGEYLGFVSEGTNDLAPVESCLILNGRLETLFEQVQATLPREDFKPSRGHKWNFIDLDDEMTLEDLVLNRRRPFRQGNSHQNERMREWVKARFATLPRHWPIIDLFCGSGNFTEVLSALGFTNILAVEVQGRALEELRRKELPGVRVLPLDMTSKGSWAQVARAQPHAKAMLVDPPREGLDKRRGLFKYLDNLEQLFYISCEMDTFARDTSDLLVQGWKLQELAPLDLFPHTPHVEVLSHFKRI